MTWTQFWDMNSGGGPKLEWSMIYIEAPEEEAKSVFFARFGNNPERVSCTCCGDDYSISEYETLEEATAFHRGLRFVTPAEDWRELSIEARREHNEKSYYLEPGNPVPNGFKVQNFASYRNRGKETGITLDEYLRDPEVKFILAEEIVDAEKAVYVPEQGYVWQD